MYTCMHLVTCNNFVQVLCTSLKHFTFMHLRNYAFPDSVSLNPHSFSGKKRSIVGTLVLFQYFPKFWRRTIFIHFGRLIEERVHFNGTIF